MGPDLLVILLLVVVVLSVGGGYGGRRAGWWTNSGYGGVEWLLYLIAVAALLWILLHYITRAA